MQPISVKKCKPDVNHSIFSMVTEGRSQVIQSVKDQFFQATLQRIIPLLCSRQSKSSVLNHFVYLEC